MPGTSDGEPISPPVELVRTMEPPWPLLDHRRDGDAAGVPDAGEVHGDDLVPLLLGRGETARPDAGVGDDDGDRTELGDAVVERLLQSFGVAHVGLVGLDALPERLRPGERSRRGRPGVDIW